MERAFVYFYARWSKDAGNQDTIQAQLSQCGRIWETRKLSYEVARIQEFADKGYDLEAIDLSKDYHIMLDEIESMSDIALKDARIVIVVKKLCRFVRAIGSDQSCVQKAIDLLRRKKAILVAGRSTFDFREFQSSDFQKRWRQAVNEAQLDKFETVEKLFFARGDYIINYSHVRPARAIYGYSIERDKTVPRRDPNHYKWKVIAEEAEVISLIFRLYTYTPPFKALPANLWPTRCVGTPAIARLLNEASAIPGFEHLSRESYILREKSEVDLARRIERRTNEAIERDLISNSATIRKVERETKGESKWNRNPDDLLDDHLSPYWTPNTVRNILRRTAYKGVWLYLLSEDDKTKRNGERKVLFSPDWNTLKKSAESYCQDNNLTGIEPADISDYFDFQQLDHRKVNYFLTHVLTPQIIDTDLFDRARTIRKSKSAFFKSLSSTTSQMTLQLQKKVKCPSCSKSLGVHSKDGAPRYRCTSCKGSSAFSISASVIDSCVKQLLRAICSPEEAIKHSRPESDISPEFMLRVMKEKEAEIKHKEESLKKRRINFLASQQQLDEEEDRIENARIFEEFKAENSISIKRIQHDIDNLSIQIANISKKGSTDDTEIIKWYLEIASGNINQYSSLAQELIKEITLEKADLPGDIKDLSDERLSVFFRRGSLSLELLKNGDICHSKRDYYKRFNASDKLTSIKHAIKIEFQSGVVHTFNPYSETVLPYDLPEFFFAAKGLEGQGNDRSIERILSKIRNTNFDNVDDLIAKLKSRKETQHQVG